VPLVSPLAKIVSALATHFFYSRVGTVGRMASCATIVDLLGIATVFTLGLVAAAYWIQSPAVPSIRRSPSPSSSSGLGGEP
jgi:hypothetical protein